MRGRAWDNDDSMCSGLPFPFHLRADGTFGYCDNPYCNIANDAERIDRYTASARSNPASGDELTRVCKGTTDIIATLDNVFGYEMTQRLAGSAGGGWLNSSRPTDECCPPTQGFEIFTPRGPRELDDSALGAHAPTRPAICFSSAGAQADLSAAFGRLSQITPCFGLCS